MMITVVMYICQLMSDDNWKTSIMRGTLPYVFGSCEHHSGLTEEMHIPLKLIHREDTQHVLTEGALPPPQPPPPPPNTPTPPHTTYRHALLADTGLFHAARSTKLAHVLTEGALPPPPRHPTYHHALPADTGLLHAARSTKLAHVLTEGTLPSHPNPPSLPLPPFPTPNLPPCIAG